ncbi:MAG: transaldolase [Steroidobacteraceae bacterium]
MSTDSSLKIASSKPNRLHLLNAAGQSVWLDFITRDLLRSGDLARLIAVDGIAGVTSNPSLFQKAISNGTAYEKEISALARQGMTALQIYEALAIADIRDACDLLAPVYERTQTRDGYVSLEVNPHLADDATATLLEARRLFNAVARPNVMIKIPATAAALPAITSAIAEGINVNVTLIFSVERYEQVLDAWLGGLEAAICEDAPTLSRTSSVASFFISRVDAALDPVLQKNSATAQLQGAVAIANAANAYSRFLAMRASARFRALAARGAIAQRPLWASTSPKSSAYRDVVYVEDLVTAQTVNTLPPQTLAAFRDHGAVHRNLADSNVQTESTHVLSELQRLGVDLRATSEQLEREGVKLFADAFDSLIASIVHKSTYPTAT